MSVNPYSLSLVIFSLQKQHLSLSEIVKYVSHHWERGHLMHIVIFPYLESVMVLLLLLYGVHVEHHQRFKTSVMKHSVVENYTQSIK